MPAHDESSAAVSGGSRHAVGVPGPSILKGRPPRPVVVCAQVGFASLPDPRHGSLDPRRLAAVGSSRYGKETLCVMAACFLKRSVSGQTCHPGVILTE
jgi:hypothetical protein